MCLGPLKKNSGYSNAKSENGLFKRKPERHSKSLRLTAISQAKGCDAGKDSEK
jgi:hypothetical protein